MIYMRCTLFQEISKSKEESAMDVDQTSFTGESPANSSVKPASAINLHDSNLPATEIITQMDVTVPSSGAPPAKTSKVSGNSIRATFQHECPILY